MELKERINIKYFLFFSVITALLFIPLLNNIPEKVGFFTFYISVLISFIFLMHTVEQLIEMGKNGENINSSAMFKMMFIHLVILLMGLGIGVHFMGNRIIFALINYSIQIFVLVLCMRRKSTH